MLPGLIRALLILLLGLGLTAADIGVAAGQVPADVGVSDTLWQIRLTDGSTFFGRIVAVTPERLTVTTGAGATLEVERSRVAQMTVARGTVRNGVVWPNDPNRTRLFFGPTGRMLEKGEGYLGVFELFLPFASYGVNDFLTVAGGTPVIPEVIGRIFYFAPKIGGQINDRTAVSGGVLAFYNAEADDSDIRTVGILYGVGTYGSEDNGVTFGLGWGFAGDEVENRPVAMLGLERRTSPRLKLISENYLVSYEEDTWNPNGSITRKTQFASLISGGVRLFGERLSADAGLGVMVGEGESFCCLPLVNFVYNFGAVR